MNDEERIKRVEEAILIMKDLLLRHEERLDENYNEIKNEKITRQEFRKDFEFKLNALIDSQIRSEAEIIEIKEAIKELKEVSQAHLKRIENLENQ
jgi:hypothetical protein